MTEPRQPDPRRNPDAPSGGGADGATTVPTAVGGAELAALLRAELWAGWRRGQRPAVESFLPRLTAAGCGDEVVLDLVYSEIAFRTALDETPELDEYVRRFPGLAAALRRHFALLGESQRTAMHPADTAQELPAVRPPATATTMTFLPPGNLVAAPARSGVARGAPEVLAVPAPPTAAAAGLTRKSGIEPAAQPGGQPRTRATDETQEGPPPYRLPLSDDEWPALGEDSALQETRGAEPGQRTARAVRGFADVTVPGFEIVGLLGRGGMGVVYKARQKSLDRLVALKMLLTEAHSGPEQLARFRNEAAAIAHLQHPNIVQIHEVDEYRGRPYCVLEFMEGGSLDKRLDGKPLRPPLAATLTQTLAHAIEAAHRAGIIHRDLKPGNVLLADGPAVPLERCQLKVSDFGLAKQRDDDAWQTRSSAILGTPSYMAPEQAGGHPELMGPCTDVYALGAILYEFLTGRPPFQGTTALETVMHVVHEEPVPPSRLNAKVPRDLETICLKCLQKEPAKRYASAQALADDLGRFLHNEPILARPTGNVERLIKWAGRRPAAAALIVVSALTLLFLGVGGVVYYQSRAQLAEQLLARRDRIDGVRKDVRALLDQVKKLMQARAWDEASRLLVQAETKAADEADSLGELAEEIRPLMDEVRARLKDEDAARRQRETELAEQRQRDQARQLQKQFEAHRDDTLLHASMSVGDDRAEHVRSTRESARHALAVFEVQAEGTSLPRVPPALDAPDAARVHRHCYELLLVLAEATAQPPEARPADAATALRVLDHAARLIPRTRAWHLRRARCYDLLGNRRAADAEERAARGWQPQLALDYYLVGEQHYKEGDVEVASQEFRQALRLDFDHFWARYLLAVCHVRLNRTAEARETLTACCKDRPEFVWPYLMLGFVNGQLQDFAAAEDAFAHAERLAGKDPDARCALYANRGLLRIGEGKVAEGLDDLRRAVGIRPRQYQVHLSLALIYEGRRDWARAEQEFQQAIDAGPGVASLYRIRARFHLRRHDLQAALRDFATAIATDSPDGAAADLAKDQAWRGRILHRLRDYKQAVAAYDRAVKLRPDYADAYLWRGEALLQLRDYPAAAASLDEYVRRQRWPVAAAYRARALARSELGRYPEAIQDYGRALELEPETAAAHAALGVALAGGSGALSALSDLGAVLEARRGRAALYAARGWVYLAYQAPLLALPDFEAAVRLAPQGGQAYNGRGLARVRLGRHQEGTADADLALQHGPASPELCYGAARVFAQAVAAVTVTLDGSYRDRLAQGQRGRYRERAFTLLSRALRLSSPGEARLWRKRLQRDSALEPIRTDPRFAGLLDATGRPTASNDQGPRP
jgi:tetratricopeptide (TPR) repeat protein/tRNA A-37 threonylcarbamoyl transferase component Bud32